jgi:transglutaminase-like putative cysteine protease
LAQRSDRSASSFLSVTFAFKAACVTLMIATPLFGVWLASSLAAFANRATWLPVASGLLLFPGLPLAWEGIGVLRARRDKKAKGRRRFLTFSDRLILRTLAINILFLVVLLAAYPSRAFVALSTRGDWMLDGRHGPSAERARGVLLAFAGTVEWLYAATHDNPYREGREGQGDGVDPTPTPTPTPTAAPSSTGTGTAPLPSSSSSPPEPVASSSISPVPVPVPVPVPDLTPAPAKPRFPSTLHPAVVSMPPEAEVSIASVGKYILAHEPDPMLRVKALHDWVADRIAYDTPNYVAHKVPDADRDAQAVFRSRVGVCAGYAKLLTELAKVTGDEILYVVGDARSEASPMEGEGHAWNAAHVGGSWYLIDATWDSGSNDNGTFKKRYGTEYLFTAPDQFAITHFPDAAKWQLLEHPLSRAEFFRRPVLAPAFFAHGLELRTPDRSQVSVAGSLDVALGNPRNVFVLGDFTPKHGGTRTECKGDQHTALHCDFPVSGTYDVRLYANDKRYGTYAYAGSVEVNARP